MNLYTGSKQVYYHEFTQGTPILFVEKFEDFASILNTPMAELNQDSSDNSKLYFKSIGFKNSPLKFIVFEDRMLRTLFGGRNKSVIDSTLALYAGNKKFPKNEKAALECALTLSIKERRKGAYTLLSKLYSSKFGTASELTFEE